MKLEMGTLPQMLNNVFSDNEIKIFSGRANPSLASEIAEYLNCEVCDMVIKNFSDGEIYVQVQDSVRGKDVFVVQPLSEPINENLMELLIIIDAFKRASAKTITAVLPYYGYARQDRKTTGREAITAKLVADLLTTAGATRILTMDLHSGQIQGFFNILVDHIYSTSIFSEYIKNMNIDENLFVAVSPDAGGVQRTRVFAKAMGCPLAIVDKRRVRHNEAIADHIIGEVKDKVCIMFDDMIDTAGTICEAAKLLKSEGAKEVYVCAAHGIFSADALKKLENAPIKEVIVTNSIPIKSKSMPEKITHLSVAPLLGEAILRIHNNESVSELFGFEKEYKA